MKVIVRNGTMSKEETDYYIQKEKEFSGNQPDMAVFTIDPLNSDFADVDFTYLDIVHDRIRRIKHET
jgi:hypothetical protein